MTLKNFEDLTIKELRILHEQYKNQHPDTKTAQELLEEIKENE